MNNGFQLLTTFAKNSILDVGLDSEQVFFLFHLPFTMERVFSCFDKFLNPVISGM